MAASKWKMGTQYPELFQALSAEFEPDEVKELPKRGRDGKPIPYVTARTCMNRLDTVLGNERWTEEYLQSGNSVICRLTITLPDGTTLTKSDAGGFAGMKEADNDVKSGFSDAFKRACYKLGVARYLYRDGVPYYDADASRYNEQEPLQAQATRSVSEDSQRVHHGAHQTEKTPSPQPSTVRTPAESEGQALGTQEEAVDWDNSFWVHLTNEISRRNIAFQATHPDIEEGPIDPSFAVMHLVWLTWEAGLHPMSPTENPTVGLGQWVQVLEKIGKTSPKHRKRLEDRLKEYLDEKYKEAENSKAPKSTRGPR
jgi:hypothetical protein